MKIWYDALTGKHVRYGAAIARHLRKKGHQLTLTTRRHPDTTSVAEFLGEEFTVIGQYNPKTLLTRLQSSAKRQLALCKLFQKNIFDVAVSHGSADLCRIGFGLDKPVITTLDTPYADAVHRLTLPLSKYVVMSKSIETEPLQKYNVDAQNVFFEGVDEVAWIKGATPHVNYDFPKPLIIVRPLEDKAVYTQKTMNMTALAKNLTRLGTVVFLSRYHRKPVKGLIVPDKFVDSVSLTAQADLFIGVGGTITREAALQGTPAIVLKVFQKQEVNDYLIGKGFPIYNAKLQEIPALAEKLLGKKTDAKPLLEKLEDPLDTIANLVERSNQNK